MPDSSRSASAENAFGGQETQMATVQRLRLFPDTTRIENDSLTMAGQNLASLADRYGTPLYIYDRATMDEAAVSYRSALAKHYPGPADITYAGKAFLCLAIAQWTQQNKLWLDCTGEGELAFAAAARAKRERVLVHGVNKSAADLKSAVRLAGTMVIDNLTELERIENLASDQLPSLWLRWNPGIPVETHHAHTQTGQHESKFGMTNDEMKQAVQSGKKAGLRIDGIHFHQGSNFRDPSPLLAAIELALDLAKEIGFDDGWHFSPGGGWGVAYNEDELPHPEIETYTRLIFETVKQGCKARGLGLPHLHIEPGRSLVARAGVAVYRVGAIKKRDGRTWLLTDGGMADNPRHAMYGARYSCLTVAGPGRERIERVHIAGPCCESGDVIIEDLPMPEVKEGELIAVPMSGAYQLSMSSNYNGTRRPAVIWLEKGSVRLIQRRETTDDLLRRDTGLW